MECIQLGCAFNQMPSGSASRIAVAKVISLCSCLCHLPLQTAVGMPRDASAYSTEHQVITTAPSCVVASVRRLSHPLCRPACSGGRSGELEQVQGGGLAGPRCNPASSQGGLSTSCSALAPRARCGAASPLPGQPLTAPALVPESSRRPDAKTRLDVPIRSASFSWAGDRCSAK